MITLIKVLALIKGLTQAIYFLYLYQLKEYRLDRLSEHIARTNKTPLQAIYNLTLGAPLSRKKLPKLTFKSVMIAGLVFLLLSALLEAYMLFGVLTAIFATPLVVITARMMLFPLEWLARFGIYTAAKLKVRHIKNGGKLTVIGITGSFGKSTTKHILHHVLSTQYKTVQTPGSINTPLGISLLILRRLSTSHRFLIVEMGAYKQGEIEQLCSIAQPDIGIITAISSQHKKLFGSLQAIIKAKSELLEYLPPKSLSYINKAVKKHLPISVVKKLNTAYYSEKNLPPFALEALKASNIPTFLHLNVVPAVLFSKRIEMSQKNISQALQSVSLPSRVMNIKKVSTSTILVDDSLNANYEGVIAAFSYIAKAKQKNKIAIMPCLIELGSDASKLHNMLGKRAAQAGISLILTTDDYLEDVKNGAGAIHKVHFAPSLSDIKKILKKVRSPRILLLEGKINKDIRTYIEKHA